MKKKEKELVVVLPNIGNVPEGYIQIMTPRGKKTIKV